MPPEIVRLIPQGFEVFDYLAGQLTDAPRRDYLVVIHHPVDTMQHASLRPLLIFTQQANGHYVLAARNDGVVLQADEGGMGDPYTDSGDGGLAIKDRYFTVQQGVAAGISHYTDYITFHYNSAQRDWLFHKEIFIDIQPTLQDPPKPKKSMITRADPRHKVSFVDWRPDFWCEPENGHQGDSYCKYLAQAKGKHS